MKAIVSIILGTIGLLISSCGLLVLENSFKGGRGGGIWLIALPCVIVGGLLLWAAVALWQSWRKSRAASKAEPSPHDVTPPS
jgi:hypothetical protein